MRRALCGMGLVFGLVGTLFACSSGSGANAGGSNAGGSKDDGGASDTGSPVVNPGEDGGAPGTDGSANATDAGGPGSDGNAPPASDGGYPAGWLYTEGGKIYELTGSAGTPWMGRGVNVDDIFFCGYDNTLWMTSPDQTLETVISGLVSAWKPNFVRISLSMDSYTLVTSWIDADAGQYKTPMTGVIDALGSHPGLYTLVTLRSDASMIGQDTANDPEATGLPSDKTTTPNATTFPTGTDATYIALVDSFANSSFVLFGLTNEPGGNTLSNATIAAAMSHAVGVIRAEEDRLKVPHHIVSVQGNGWTSDISFYATSPLPYDNVVYEIHGYPPTMASYTYANIPVIIGEYGTLSDSTTFYADLESKQIPNLAWDFDSYSDCAPDLLNVNQSDTSLVPSTWGSTVQAYLLAHAP